MLKWIDINGDFILDWVRFFMLLSDITNACFALVHFYILFCASELQILGRHHVRRRYSSKLNDEDSDSRPTEWESKMAAAYENLAADTIYDAEDLHSDTYKKVKYNCHSYFRTRLRYQI